jgi:hypothetical protein
MSDFEAHPCDSCSKHFPDECPNYIILGAESRANRVRTGCEKLVAWVDSIVEHYIP